MREVEAIFLSTHHVDLIMLQAIMFDYDGTITPTLKRQEKWFKLYAAKHRKKWPFKDFPSFLDFYNEKCALEGGVQNVYDALGLPGDMSDRSHPVWHAYEKFNQNHPQALYPRMKETIKQIWQSGQLTKDPRRNRRLRMGINTTNSWGSIYNDLEKGGVMPYFNCFVTEEVLREYQGAGNPEPLKKPSKISLALMLGLMDSNGAYTLHVGDTRNDLRSSQKVIRLNPMHPETLITVGACYGYEGREILEQGVETPDGVVKFDYLIDDPRELGVDVGIALCHGNDGFRLLSASQLGYATSFIGGLSRN